ncbi:MAG: hypothetical protein UU73_C0004G0019 [Candidatus Daviesbacteria bacterium GW2011_GWA1_41_61]|uniref:Uncharacterized protein n=1 Tax=Candidatus Daviesbacteria bacterium GW2011_GWA2_40_9 TaxID=1618424 RepID=A0A0G0U7W9_9BACT|nr:MAG: hypothetical protein UU26_C0011G0016 [Candidatus Daviesbacteria bacterium GW2011_GWC1_40_9]KKR83346.1 MAG: hypothetical protein UU29_C0006G0035 [Candidatus Daviesbacteria bacterium GW2011_GWA2_40_9]KKR93223.1 MAG: hypothetical protein UU44_C0003G0019 [Candidatus Daviesbacteria bacterium GW2011_GWB1_41_15]KKS14711.1 MAG: hypothetical protein UU73_C0004G0019 [Candidatus Daviesbacteria bacterium GW2011_GWA1_41_61]
MSGCGTVISYEIIALLPLTFCPDLRKIIPMPDISNPKDKSQMAHLPPPSGDSAKAEKYLSQLIKLINQNKLLVNHTDLAQFDPSAIEDHYRMELKQYHVEISHSKQPETGQDFYIMLFTNLQDIRDGCSEKIILAYMHLTQEQFKRFKTTADEQVERRRKEEEEKRFAEMMTPVDEVLQKIEASDTLEEDLQEIAKEPIPRLETPPAAEPALQISQLPQDTTISPTIPQPGETPFAPFAPSETNFSAAPPSGDQKGVADLLNDFSGHYSSQPSYTPPEISPAPQPTYSLPSSSFPAPTAPSSETTLPPTPQTPTNQTPQY